jgi:catechol 2,3-dioxygenase-like lactoylglutathione lyase family enzyme
MGYRFHHMHLICRDLEGMIRFFSEVLGARLVLRRKFGTADGASLDMNGATINLRVAKGDEVLEEGSVARYGYDHLGVEVDDFEKAYDELRSHGFEFYTPIQESHGIRFAFFKGPEDIRVELVQRIG